MRLVLLAMVLMLLPSCATTEDVPPGGPTGPGMKTVSSKQAPSTLIAVDGTICNVMPKKYEETDVGDTAWCDWRNRSAGPPRASQIPASDAAEVAAVMASELARSGHPVIVEEEGIGIHVAWPGRIQSFVRYRLPEGRSGWRIVARDTLFIT